MSAASTARAARVPRTKWRPGVGLLIAGALLAAASLPLVGLVFMVSTSLEAIRGEATRRIDTIAAHKADRLNRLVGGEAPLAQAERAPATLLRRLSAPAVATIFHDRRGLGGTAVIMAVGRVGEVLVVVEPRPGPAGELALRAVPASAHPTMGRVVGGRTIGGGFTGFDGVPCLGAWRAVEPLGMTLVVAEHAAEAEGRARRFKHDAIVHGAVALALVLLLLVGLWQRVTVPIQRLRRQADRIATGDYSPRTRPRGARQTVELAHSFNMMAHRIQAGVNALKLANQSLEGRVKSRTAELERSNAGLVAALKELEQSREHVVRQEKLAALGVLTAGIAHEINNPLMGLMNYLDFAGRKCTTPRAVQALDKAQHEVERIAGIVRNLLDFARPSMGAVLAPLDDCVRRTLELVGADLRRAGVQVELDLPAEQVLVNLLLNARDAVADAADKQVRIRAEISASWVAIEVDDGGPGVPTEHRGRIFDPFFTTKPPGKGTGMGLAVSYNLLRGMGGGLYQGRSDRGGASFRVVLMRHAPTQPGPAHVAAMLRNTP